MKEGDIFQTLLKNGMFGAVKILKTGGKFDFSTYEFFLISITPYVGHTPPTADDIRSTSILTKNYLFPKGEKLIGIYCGKFPENFRYIGNIPLNDDEKGLTLEINNGNNNGYSSHGAITEDIGSEALFEWRYQNDRDTFTREIQEARAGTEALMRGIVKQKTVKRMLKDDKFWHIISLLNLNKINDDEAITATAIQELSKLKITDIKGFEEQLAHKLFQLDTKEHAKNIGEFGYKDGEYMSADNFLYARCAVIANGKEIFNEVVGDPKKILKDMEFEALLSLAANAYELKTGKAWSYDAGISYETFSNSEGWN